MRGIRGVIFLNKVGSLVNAKMYFSLCTTSDWETNRSTPTDSGVRPRFGALGL